MAKSLPPVSAKVVADAEQFISEFKRADNAAKRSAANIDKEVDELSKKVSRKFQLADVGKDLLRGLGIGGGFEVASKAAEAIADHFKEAAEAAKQIEESSAESLKLIQQAIAARNTDQQNLDNINKQLRKNDELINEAMHPAPLKVRVFNAGSNRMDEQLVAQDANVVEAERLKKESQELAVQAAELQKKINETAKATGEKAHANELESQSERVKILSKDYELLQGVIKKVQGAVDEQDKALAEDAEKFKQLADPTKKFADQLKRIDELLGKQLLTPEEAAGASAAVKAEAADDQMRRINKALEEFYSDYDRSVALLSPKVDKVMLEIQDAAERAADGMAEAWVDSVNGVEGAWKNLGNAIAREIEFIVAKVLVVQPLIAGLGKSLNQMGDAGLGGIWSTLGSAFVKAAGGKARGGGVEPGYTYQVNENGQEFFRPNVGGTVMPVGASAGMRGGGGGDVYQIDARGADQAAFARLESIIRQLNGSIERRSIAAVAAAKRRGGRDAAALA